MVVFCPQERVVATGDMTLGGAKMAPGNEDRNSEDQELALGVS